LRKAFIRYESLKARRRLVDFDDLIVRSEELLASSKDTRRELRQRYRHIMVDEFQDLNRVQLRLLQHLGGAPRRDRSLLFVGDPGQSIFRFRGACFENWAEVQDGAEKLPLSVNYRSSAPIVALANAVDDFTSIDRPATRARKNAPNSPMPQLTAYPDKRSEAAAICDQIERLRGKGYPLSEQAILVRDSNFIRQVISELRARKIPYRKIGGASYPPPPLARDVMAVLEVGANPKHIPALMHTLQLLPGIGPKRVRKLLSQLKPRTSRKSLISFLRKKLAGRPGRRHLIHALEAADPTSPNVAGVIENVIRSIVRLNNELERGSSSFRGESVMDSVLEQAEGMTTLLDVVNIWALHSNDDRSTDSADYVSVSTIHSAKGREWPVVYIPQLVDDHLPHSKCSTGDQVAEERRLFYVAVTRAKRYLYLSHTAGTGTAPPLNGKPSRFLDLPGVMDLLDYREVAK
jgi:DNA helicase II / ATP-dependent DNA helicase PcrA